MKTAFTVLLLITGITVLSQPKRIKFTPSTYYRNFSHKIPAVARILPGDTIDSESVDAGGFNKMGTSVTERGNPLTGPFYIEDAMPGDVIAITFTHVTLSRDYATTVETFVERSLPMEVIKPVYARNARLARWNLYRDQGYASPEKTYTHLGRLRVPLRPFLGCVGVAAPIKDKEPLSYFAGQYGGNMDFYKVTTGATVYLPVFHAGGLLYIGDGHAAQGDGEINGDALETSMEFTFVTRVIKSTDLKINYPRIEDSQHIIAIATDEKMEEALKKATLGLLNWVQDEYGLTLNEATQVIGPAIEYKIPTLAGPRFEIAAMLPKEHLKGLTK
jgi:amidase